MINELMASLHFYSLVTKSLKTQDFQFFWLKLLLLKLLILHCIIVTKYKSRQHLFALTNVSSLYLTCRPKGNGIGNSSVTQSFFVHRMWDGPVTWDTWRQKCVDADTSRDILAAPAVDIHVTLPYMSPTSSKEPLQPCSGKSCQSEKAPCAPTSERLWDFQWY